MSSRSEKRFPTGDLAGRVPVPIEHTIPEPFRYALFHQSRGEMLDHLPVTRDLLAHHRGSEIHNELLHKSQPLSPTTAHFRSPDHAPVVATSNFD